MPPATTSGGRYAGGSDALFDDIQATGVHWLNGSYEDVEFRAGSCASAAFSSGPAPSWNGKTPAQWPTP
ncbi:MAG: hypothetical protein ACLUIR_02100 [Faecalibacterium prausnitzii]